jgi:hypothetical protein
MAIGEADTGWSPAPPPANTVYSNLDPAAGGTVAGVAPGVNRLVMFSDVDGDSTFSAIPDSLLDVGTAAADSAWTGWLLEPWALLENLVVEPGLASRFTLPDTLRTTLTPWAAPAPPDTQAAGLPDTTGGGDAEPAESEEDDEP